MKRKLVLLGAYDRYNYGDNLMPIVFNDYIKKYQPEILNNFDIVYSSITSSDFIKYKAPKTQALIDIYEKLENGDAIVTVGGEVLCASNATLYLHMPRPYLYNKLLLKLNKVPVFKRFIQMLAMYNNPTPWDYPYIIDGSALNNGVKVIYNTVGGSLKGLNDKQTKRIKNRISSAHYISVRDSRTFSSLIDFSTPNLAPDSVHIISDLYDDELLEKEVSKTILGKKNESYICFQSAPSKLETSIEDLVSALLDICKSNNIKIILLPIGYANGHDDYHLLKTIYDKIPEYCELVYDLNIWEILYIIKNCKCYVGTSLHGAITALSYGVPHFGFGEKIEKLNEFLNDWSCYPYNKTYGISDIVSFCKEVDSLPKDVIDAKSRENNDLIKNNFNKICSVLID
jgi:polysaccharide pyruvyl transferase WcaK-like protein